MLELLIGLHSTRMFAFLVVLSLFVRGEYDCKMNIDKSFEAGYEVIFL